MFRSRMPGYPAFAYKPVAWVALALVMAVMACNFASRQGKPLTVAEMLAGHTPHPAPTASPIPPPTATSTPTDVPTATLTQTLEPIPSATRTPYPTYTNTVIPTLAQTLLPTNTSPPTTPQPTDIPPTYFPVTPDAAGNRLQNPGFEGSTRPVGFGEVNVFEGWQPFYCDEPYTPGKCPAPRPCAEGQTTGCNPPDLLMGRPEYKPTDVSNRVHSGATAQQWFCFFRTCQAGVYQTFATTPGQVCEVGAYVQTWSAPTEYGSDGKLYTSDVATEDGRANSQWFIRVDRGGGTYAFANHVQVSRVFTYDDGHFDQYARIGFTFYATGHQTTVFFENLRLWPFAHNDSYIDDAYAYCSW